MLNTVTIILIFCWIPNSIQIVKNEQQENISCKCGVGRQTKIVGGDKAIANEFPWAVALTYNGFFGCGGSLINEKYVLTAAHCINNVNPKLMKVVLGAHNLTDPNEKGVSYHPVQRIIKHEGYSEFLLINDIALLELKDEVKMSETTKPICMPDPKELYKGRNLTVAGWGYQKEDNPKVSEVLHKVAVTVLGNPRCRKSYFRFIFKTHICAGYEVGGKDACQGDSGGPLMVKNNNHWHIAGIVSYGKGCARRGYPGVYTRVNKFLPWITKKINGTKLCTPNKNFCGKLGAPSKVVGGEETEPSEFPWMAAFMYNGNLRCGATLINDRFVVTAAHCVQGINSRYARIYLGAHNISLYREKGRVEMSVVKVIIHPQYSTMTHANDIALMELNKPVSFNTKVATACLPPGPEADYESKDAIVIGWGRTEEGGRSSTVLRKAIVPIVPSSTCKDNYGRYRIDPDRMLCAGLEEGGKDACQGDSGGPLMLDNQGHYTLIGVVSFGQGCARPAKPGVYARVAYYTDFISNHTKDALTCPAYITTKHQDQSNFNTFS
uniref:Peptidase S1 domain-containing protein n=1 Tax=Strigamia maritima TaxID=126957 RepID=T1J1Z5_STRMM